MSINLSQRAGAAPELLETMTGSTILIGTLQFNPVMIIFDNQGTVAVSIYVNQTADVWKTFPAGEALVLDMRAANGVASNFTFDVGTSFYGNGASGDFSISYIYAINT
jgi:hypothetical protein